MWWWMKVLTAVSRAVAACRWPAVLSPGKCNDVSEKKQRPERVNLTTLSRGRVCPVPPVLSLRRLRQNCPVVSDMSALPPAKLFHVPEMFHRLCKGCPLFHGFFFFSSVSTVHLVASTQLEASPTHVFRQLARRLLSNVFRFISRVNANQWHGGQP